MGAGDVTLVGPAFVEARKEADAKAGEEDTRA